MKRIELEKIKVEGIPLSQWYLSQFEESIRKRIKNRRGTVVGWDNVCSFLLDNLKSFLVAPPDELEALHKHYWTKMPKIDAGELEKMKKKVLDSFGYNEFRKNKLIEFAEKIHVTCCPYCNQNYTICIGPVFSKEKKALLQFDHFFCKKEYPELSMSMYNLVPACYVCNHEKGDKNLCLDFHPYCNDICKEFTFKIDSPIPFFAGASSGIEKINIEVEKNKNGFEKYNEFFHIEERYNHHKDVAEEIFARAYQSSYYSNESFFPFLSNDQGMRMRVVRGFYPEEKDINRRPLTKFCQDMWRQANQNR